MTKIAASQRQEVADLCIAGKSMLEVAADYGVTRACIAAILRNLGVKLPKVGPGRHGNWRRVVSPDAYQAMADMYKSGKSLAEVGAAYGVTRERVRQILTALGVGKMDGGSTMKQFCRVGERVEVARARNERREVYWRAKWGMSLADYQAHVDQYGSTVDPASPMSTYVQQRGNAKRRGISWNLTFPEWWGVWQESGKWDERGLRKDGYVMGRWGSGDVPYSVGTVRILTQSQNSKDSYIVSPGAERAAKARITRAQKLTGASA